MINRKAQIKSKGFNLDFDDRDTRNIYSDNYNAVDFSKLKVGVKTLEDAIVKLGDLSQTNPNLGDKKHVLEAIDRNDEGEMRKISNFFFKTSGIYNRLCRYMAYLYRYDWIVTPYILSDKVNTSKVKDDFNKILFRLDNFEIKKFLGDSALKVIKNGCYYGYIVTENAQLAVQELPPAYCRSRMFVNGRPVVEFNMKFFDDTYKDVNQRVRIIKSFPKEFAKGYSLYKEGKLVPDYMGDSSGWYVLSPDKAIKFSLNEYDFPAFISVIPAIIDLDEAQALDRKKMMQKLLKIIIQKMPMDKNGDLIFDIDEAAQLHNNAVRMLGKAIGIDVLTTFADVDVADMSDRGMSTANDELLKVERTVYNQAGVSQMQFNTDGNIALEKSILNDEAAMYNLLLQFESFLNILIKDFNKNPKKIHYKVQLLTTTIYNYKDLSKLYKEQTQMGYSKILPQVALGQSQSSILANAYFENEILNLVDVFVPPMTSNTMSADALRKKGKSDGEEKTPGRKEKEDDQKSEKTIQNRESMN